MSGRDGVQSGSITRGILARQPKVLILCPQDNDGLTVLNQLRRIGCDVEMQWPPPKEISADVELIFLSIVPDVREISYEWLGDGAPPIISISSFENPALMDEALRIGVMGMLTAPVRASGLLSAMVMALSHHRTYEKQAARIAKLEKKFANFRTIEEGKAILMRMQNMSDDEAYARLRSEAQSLRMPIEEVARNLIHADRVLQGTLQRDMRAGRQSDDDRAQRA
jgi:AmiR/NasT family two-component response regulator